jgi:hypothetical protein
MDGDMEFSIEGFDVEDPGTFWYSAESGDDMGFGFGSGSEGYDDMGYGFGTEGGYDDMGYGFGTEGG